ncbi:hypothetical protein, partial [Providencia rettgeri]|uniref:hypothetical protein n=1 Tax=Providencia rettgeri TaxID=587 RepID=UPI00236017C9
HAPAFATRIDEQTARIERYIKNVSEVRRLGTANQNEQAIALVHSAIDPTFSAMLGEGNTLADDINAYMRKAS